MQAAWTPHKKKVDATEVTKAPMHSVLASSRKTAGYIRSHKIKLQALKFRTMGRLFKGHYTPLSLRDQGELFNARIHNVVDINKRNSHA